MAREVLSNEELAALNAAASQQARPAAFWLLKIHICYLLSAGVGICTAFYPDFVVRWLLLDTEADQASLHALLQTRSLAIATVLLVGYFSYRYAENLKLVLSVLLSIVIMDTFLDIPMFYSQKMFAPDLGFELLIVTRVVLIYSLTSVLLRVDGLPAAPRRFFTNPFHRDPYAALSEPQVRQGNP